MKVGIIGLPQGGQTTVFNAITGAHGEVGGYHGRGHLDVAVLKVPDARLAGLEAIFKPKELVHATVEFEDIVGIFAHLAGAAEEGGVPMAVLREADAILTVLRCFEDPTVLHIKGEPDPQRDLGIARDDLLIADLAVLENRIQTVQSDLRRPSAEKDNLGAELELLERCRSAIEEGKGILSVEMGARQEKMLRSFAFLTLKPMLCVLNLGEDQLASPPVSDELARLEPPPIAMCGKLEMEMMELDEADREAFMQDAGIEELASGKIVRACYELLEQRSFFTFVSEKVRAWSVKAGENALDAAGKIHSDMVEGFIRAEVVAFNDLMECGSLQDARSAGKVRLEGRDYEVQDGDVITFRFSS